MSFEGKSMYKEDRLKEIDEKKKEWEEGTLKETLKRFKAKEKIADFYTPADLKNYNFLDKIASNWTINAPANIILAMYIALAEQRGIPLSKLRGTLQNDILKEYIGRGTYIFPPAPSMRMVGDTIVYCTKNMPQMNFISCSAAHIRQALHRDAARIIQFEARLGDVLDPLAGSYYVEALTDRIEEEAWEIYHEIEAMGGSVAAVENGFMPQEVARSAYERQKEIENGKVLRVGVNCFTGEHVVYGVI
ncbi:MAG: hypothetical protein C4589_10925 [Peptococcaceae bacterium]|nr:MAG: hypothetical protein C4589_10925 [Peptococcaceae bacterium]